MAASLHSSKRSAETKLVASLNVLTETLARRPFGLIHSMARAGKGESQQPALPPSLLSNHFGMDIAMDFLKIQCLSKIFRGHERRYSGFYELEKDNYSVITVFSAVDPMISYCPSRSPPWMVDVTNIALPQPNEGAIAFIDSTDSKVTWTPVTMSLLTAKIKAEQLVPGARCDHSYHGPRKCPARD